MALSAAEVLPRWHRSVANSRSGRSNSFPLGSLGDGESCQRGSRSSWSESRRSQRNCYASGQRENHRRDGETTSSSGSRRSGEGYQNLRKHFSSKHSIGHARPFGARSYQIRRFGATDRLRGWFGLRRPSSGCALNLGLIQIKSS